MSDISSLFSDRFDAAFLTEVDFADLDLGVKTRVLLDRVADRLGAEEHALLLLRRSVRTIRGHNSTCMHLIFMAGPGSNGDGKPSRGSRSSSPRRSIRTCWRWSAPRRGG